MKNFKEIAKEFDHNVDALKNDQVLISRKKITSIDELKDWVKNSDMVNNMASTTSAKVSDEAPKDDIVSRGMNYIFGNGDLTAQEKKILSNAIPKSILQLSAQDKVLEEGEIWELGKSSAPVDININKLTMNPGSAIRAYNTAVNMTIGELEKITTGSTTGSVNYDFGFFGLTGRQGATGSEGGQGGAGKQGDPGKVSSPGIAGPDGTAGGNGEMGATGGKGYTGEEGLPCMPATIRIGKFTNDVSLVVATKSGEGGLGGQGGKGGKGGTGGRGGDGITTGCESNAGGNGGAGGKGGKGGEGGQGGNGVNGFDISIMIPMNVSKSKIIKIAEDAQPGEGGPGGIGGDPGDGGEGGSSSKHSNGGRKGDNGGYGDTGNKGEAGTVVGAPGTIFVQQIS